MSQKPFAFLLLSIPIFCSVPRNLSSEDLYKKCSPRIVIIESINQRGEVFSQGSGVIFDGENIITNKHVIDGASGIRIKQLGNSWVADRILIDPLADLAIIKCKTEFSKINTINSNNLQIGQKVFAIGNPIGLELSISDGIISSIRQDSQTTFLQTTTPISPGSSGGGLFTAQGQLAGITTFTYKNTQNINFAISSEEIPTSLDRAVPYQRKLLTKQLVRRTMTIQELQNLPNKQLLQEALSNDPFAQEQLGLRYSMGADIINGQFISKAELVDNSKYVYWLNKAAENGNINAAIALGMDYHNGINIDFNDAEAKRLFLLAVDSLAPNTSKNSTSSRNIENTLLTVSVPLSAILMKEFAINNNKASGVSALVWCQITNLISSKQRATRNEIASPIYESWEKTAFDSSSKVLSQAAGLFGNEMVDESREQATALLHGLGLNY